MAKYHSLQLVLIGSGRVAHSLGHALKEAGHCIAQIYSPTLAHAKSLATELSVSMYTNSISELTPNADCYIIAVKDDAIADVVKLLNIDSGLVVHTSGSTPVDVFKENAGIKHYGVFYPFQTFTNKLVSFHDIPIFIESPFSECVSLLKEMGESISSNTSILSSDNRLRLHIAAVFACNFLNHILVLSDKILRDAGLNFSILQALASETISNAFSTDNPIKAQTGPAARNDIGIINKHIELLATRPDLQAIYQQLTASIIKQQNEQL